MADQNSQQERIAPLLKAFALDDQLRAQLATVLNALPNEVLNDFLEAPQLQITAIERHKRLLGKKRPPQTFLSLPGADGRGSRSVALKRKLESCDRSFCLYVIAHELAHAHLHNGRWGEITDREDAADALAEAWGFPRPSLAKSPFF